MKMIKRHKNVQTSKTTDISKKKYNFLTSFEKKHVFAKRDKTIFTDQYMHEKIIWKFLFIIF